MSNEKGKTPAPPTYLTKEQKTEWRKLVAAQPEGFFNVGHSELILSYVSATLLLKEANALISADGYLAEGSQGQVIQHPAVRMQAEAIKLLNTLSARLAIDPATQRQASTTAHSPGPNGQKGAWQGLVE